MSATSCTPARRAHSNGPNGWLAPRRIARSMSSAVATRSPSARYASFTIASTTRSEIVAASSGGGADGPSRMVPAKRPAGPIARRDHAYSRMRLFQDCYIAPNSILFRPERRYRQRRAEGLFLHRPHVVRRTGNDRRRKEQCVAVPHAAGLDLCTVASELFDMILDDLDLPLR